MDISPDTDADFVISATFAEEPSPDEVNIAIVECLEGSEREDELVAQQMQQALEMGNGKLDISDRANNEDDDEGEDDEFDDWYDLWNEDSV